MVLQCVKGIAFSTALSVFYLLAYYFLHLTHGGVSNYVRRSKHKKYVICFLSPISVNIS